MKKAKKIKARVNVEVEKTEDKIRPDAVSKGNRMESVNMILE